MSRINQIEQRLLALSPAGFEKLLRQILEREYDYPPNFVHLGVVSGKETTRKGTPDIWFTRNENEANAFVFVSLTTQVDGLFDKINEDIGKCKKKAKELDTPIDKVIFACTGKISVEEFETLQKEVKTFANDFEFWGIDRITSILTLKHLDIAENELGIKIRKGSIETLDQFTKNSKFATDQTNAFFFREKEKETTRERLLSDRRVVISGKPGCGKTRLAIEIAKDICKDDPSFSAHVIKNQGTKFCEDLPSYDTSKKHILIIDDANRAAYFSETLNFVDEYPNLYLIITVRDYAASGLIKKIDAKIANICLLDLGHEDIKHIITEGFSIDDPEDIKYILTISKGNLRFAVMAASLYNTTGIKQDSFKNLLDNYFDIISSDLGIKEPEQYLKVLIIVAFFQRINIEDTVLTESILEQLGMTLEDFIAGCHYFEGKEVFNLHFDDSIVEIADQILATYVLHRYVLEREIVKLSELFSAFYPSHKNRFVELIQSLLYLYGEEDKVRELILTQFEKYKLNKDTAIDFLRCFQALIPTQSLCFIQKMIKEIPKNIERKYEQYGNDIYSESILLLGGYESTEYDHAAIDILLTALSENGNLLSEVAHILSVDYSVTVNSHKAMYRSQEYLLEKIVGLLKTDNDVFKELFIEFAKKQIKLIHESAESGIRNVTFYRTPLRYCERTIRCRRLLWEGLGILTNEDKYNERLKEVFQEIDPRSDKLDKKLFNLDAELAMELYRKLPRQTLKEKIYAFEIARHYIKENKLGLLYKEDRHLPTRIFFDFIVNEKRIYFREKGFVLSLWVLLDSYENLVGIIADSLTELEDSTPEWKKWQTGEVISAVFEYIHEKNPESYIDFLASFLQQTNTTECAPHGIVKNAFLHASPQKLYKILRSSGNVRWHSWVASFFVQLPKEKITDELYSEALEFFSKEHKNGIVAWGNERVDNLLHFEEYKKGFVLQLCKAALEGTVKNIVVEDLFWLGSNSLSFDDVYKMFADDISVLYDLYFVLMDKGVHMDFRGEFARRIIERDNENLRRFLVAVYFKDRLEYPIKFIYDNENIEKYIVEIFRQDKECLPRFRLTKLIEQSNEGAFLKIIDALIQEFKNDSIKMFEISSAIINLAHERQIYFYERLIMQRMDLETFGRLQIFHGPTSWAGSQVPHIEKNIEFLTKLINSLDKTAANLPYEDVLQRRLVSLKKVLRYERIAEFNRDFES